MLETAPRHTFGVPTEKTCCITNKGSTKERQKLRVNTGLVCRADEAKAKSDDANAAQLHLAQRLEDRDSPPSINRQSSTEERQKLRVNTGVAWRALMVDNANAKGT